MDKHKALIEKACEAFTNSYHEHWEESDRWDTYNKYQKANTRIHITAALAAVYETLKEPSEEMLQAGHETLYEEAYDATMDFALAPTWQAMLSASALSSPLGKGE